MIENFNPLIQRDDESNFQYHKRLIYGKLEDKTLADYDYSELSKYAYGKEFSTDVARRLMYGSKRTLDLMAEDAAVLPDNDEIISDIDKRMMDLRKEQQKFYDQRRELNKMLMKEARSEHLSEVLKNAIESLDTTNMFEESSYILDTSGNEAVLVFSDWHYGMVTDNVYNQYNTEICKGRVKAVVKNAIERIKFHNCNKLHVFLLGDALHGAIHCSARVASEELAVDQIMHVSEMIAQSINELSKYVNSVNVYSTYGNHGRVIPNKNDNVHRDNLERLIGWWLEQRFKDVSKVNVIYDTDHEFILANVCGYEICGVHGDIDSIKTSPRLIANLFHRKYGMDIEYIVLGDKHHRESFEELGITSMLCGSLCGADDYASDKRLYSEPGQLLMIFNNEGLDAEYRLRCE